MATRSMLDVLAQWWWLAVDWFSAHAVAPALAALHLGNLLGDPQDIAFALLTGFVQIAIVACVFRPLEAFAPADAWRDGKLTWVDLRFTFVLVVFSPLLAFLVLSPFANLFGGMLDRLGVPADGLLNHIPRIQEHPYLAFGIYYAANDLAYYWMHRAQHAIPWWWALHSMHHSQRQVNCWTNSRVSWLDVVIESCLLATVGLVMGVDVGQFAVLVLLTQLVQDLAHTNTRLGFGRYLDRLIVDPRFHRQHHWLPDPSQPPLPDCNFGQVLSIWDNLFGTARYVRATRASGVGDAMIDADNHHGMLAMQWFCLRRFVGAFTRRAGWKPQFVSFDGKYRPVPVPADVDAS
ncbi:MAG: sterol desaturase family protein [Proteobacteria bacterium]|nr:sterol desaturase family protein [Pseudomonadota bacterium]